MVVRQFSVLVLVAVGVLALCTPSALAQDTPSDSVLTIETSSVGADTVSAEPAVRADAPGVEFISGKRPSWFRPIHMLSATVQGLDAHSTFEALKGRGVESNPLVKHMTSNKVAFLAVKAGVAAAVIYATDRMSKRHRVAAVVTAAVVNSAYVAIAASNYRIARASEARLGR